MESVLITGGAGFIGSHLCRSLLEDGFRVICLDNLVTGSTKNIKDLEVNQNFSFIQADVTTPLETQEKIDYVFHLASPASPIDYQNMPEETLLTNSVGTINALRLAKRNNAKFLLASTSEVYGDPQQHPQKEIYWGNANSFGPRACYDEGKRFAEAATYVYIHKHNIDSRVVRIFNTYGPDMQKDDGRVVSNFINWALQDVNIKIDGDGSQTRSFCYVSDLVKGITKAMFSKGTSGEIFNLGNPDEFTIKELAEKIILLTKSRSETIYSDQFRQDDPMKRKPDITKAQTILGWEPKVNLDEGLQKTIEYYNTI